jgi:hypothetical protein
MPRRLLTTALCALVLAFPVRAQQAAPPPATRAQPDRPLFPEEAPPAEAALGVTLFPSAVYLTSFDAGKGQRYYLYGSTASFAEVVAYYRTLLKDKGTLVFEQPATHAFDVGKYNEGVMAFPPGVTVKDYVWGDSAGYLNPKPNAQPARFATVIQIVPPPR